MSALARPGVLALLLPLSALAAAPLSLSEAQAEARAHAPEGAELDAQLRGADAVLEDAQRVFRHDPTFQASYSTGIGSSEEQAAAVGLRLPVDVSGSWTLRADVARAERDSVSHHREDGLRALDEAVAITVADVALAQRLLSRAERAAALYELAHQAERERLRVGQGNQLDVDAAELDSRGAAASVAQARGALAQARARLGRLLGRGAAADLSVEDPVEPAGDPGGSLPSDAVELDARVLSADADARASTLGLKLSGRLVVPRPTFGVDLGWRRRDIPSGAFVGPSSAGLSALWSEWEVGFSLSAPVPLLDGNREARARSTSRLLSSSARAATLRADVQAELDQAWSAYQAASEASRALAASAAIVERDFGLLEQAVRAGAMDAVARSTALRRLEEAGRRLDIAVREVRVARARWERRAAHER